MATTIAPLGTNDNMSPLLLPTLILLLTSHAHTPPLHPPPDLKFNLRTIENPPKIIRDSHTGVSKRLRDHLLHYDDFVALIDHVETQILAMVVDDISALTPDSASDLAPNTSAEGRRILSVAAFVPEVITGVWRLLRS
ncbi:hypothetical protein B0T14DRAFT_528622 [Immersiella caudata]|uniref:Uncharacterized protein n=1 Tax=Immersiella caudata TaxID=314043 RepID=A0AA40BUY1_9PEZI|nr:hypothetical protein B0T14DRAFT_528622 [Immersiella caudata]